LSLAEVVALSVAIGAVLGWVVARLSAAGRASTEIADLRARLEERTTRAALLEADLEVRQRELSELFSTRERLAADLEHERRASADKLALLGDAEAKLREAFQTLSAEALRQNNQSFLDLARTSLGEFQRTAVADLETRGRAIGELVKPVRESLEKVDSRMTFDLNVSYTFGGEGITNGLSLGLDAINLLDEEPPFVNIAQSPNGGGGFDPTLVNPVGRIIGLTLRKKW